MNQNKKEGFSIISKVGTLLQFNYSFNIFLAFRLVVGVVCGEFTTTVFSGVFKILFGSSVELSLLS